jgi:hypothetical protein
MKKRISVLALCLIVLFATAGSTTPKASLRSDSFESTSSVVLLPDCIDAMFAFSTAQIEYSHTAPDTYEEFFWGGQMGYWWGMMSQVCI